MSKPKARFRIKPLPSPGGVRRLCPPNAAALQLQWPAPKDLPQVLLSPATLSESPPAIVPMSEQLLTRLREAGL